MLFDKTAKARAAIINLDFDNRVRKLEDWEGLRRGQLRGRWCSVLGSWWARNHQAIRLPGSYPGLL